MRSEDVVKRYKKAAMDYDERAINDKYRAHEIMSLWALRRIKRKNLKILDLGCGTGLSSRGFFKKGHKVVGLDISKEMLQKAERYPFEKLICQDLERPIAVENNAFDAVMLVGTMEFIRNPLKLFKQINNKLKDHGAFLITVPKKLSKFTKLPIISYTKTEIEPLFLKSGFKVIGSKSFFGYYKQVDKTKEIVKYYGYLLEKK